MFVGRARELGELQDALDDASVGHGRVVVVAGDAGIGKTRLLQELTNEAARKGWTVLAGRCWEEGGAPAYWPWIQIVRATGGDFTEIAAGSARPPGEQADPESVRFALFDAVTRFLVDRAEKGRMLLVLEDLHAADEASLLLLRFLGESIASAPIAVLCSYREGEPRVRELASLFAGLGRVGRRLPLRGLSEQEVEAYVAGVVGEAGTPPLARRLHSVTGGNPFFLGELLRGADVEELAAWVTPARPDPGWRVPEEVRAVIRRRIDQLSPEAASLLQLAAVAGRQIEPAVLERMSRLGPSRLVDALGEAVEAGALVEDADGQRQAFAHELVRETLYGDLSARRRAELHLRLGGVLEELGQGDRRLSEIAHHLALAAPLGDVQRTIGYLERAGDRAASLLAHEEAARHYARALQLLEADAEVAERRRCDLLLRLGDAQWRAGDAAAGRASYEEATAVARGLGEGELLARAALGYVTALGGFIFYARFEVGATGAGLLEEALAAVPRDDTPLRASLLSRLAVELNTVNEPVERRAELSNEAVDVARRLGDLRALVTALHSRHWALTVPERVLERLEQTEEMLAAAEQVADREMQFLAHNARFHCFLELGDGPALDREIEAMAAVADQIRQPFYLWHTHCLRVVRGILDGRYAHAEELAGTALELGRLRHSEYPAYVFQYAQVFAIRWAQGRLGELWPTVSVHGELYPWIPRWRDALAAAELGDHRAARAEVDRHARNDFADLPRDGLWLLLLCALAEACVLIRDERRARILYELLLPYGDRNAVSYTQLPFGPVALRLAMLASLFGEWDEADRHFAAARERCELLGARGILARVAYEHARVLLSRGDDLLAAARLQEAAALAEELELTGLLERIAALGATPSETGPPLFRREGEIWTIGYEGPTFRLRDVKGLRYLALLLGSPGREIHAVELAQAVDGTAQRALADGPLGPTLDATAKDAYRQRLHDLGADLEEARAWGDPERVARAEAEVEALTTQLAQALGLHGRDRTGPSGAERARVSVTKAIRSAIKSIDRHSPALGAHLGASIRTGQFCSYAPPGERPPPWQL